MEGVDRWPPVRFYRWLFLAIFEFVFSAAVLALSVFLFTFCTPVVRFGQTVGCDYPDLSAAVALILGILLLGLGAFASLQSLSVLAPRRAESPGVVPRSGSPRTPDTPPGATSWDRVRRGLGARSWIDDYPAPGPSVEDPSASANPPSSAP